MSLDSGENQNEPEKSPQHVDKQETFVNRPLHEACRKGDLNRVNHILSQDLVDINSRDEKQGRTPLMVAAQEGNCRMFDFLISRGANMQEVDNNGNNVLHWACKGGHVDMLECVLRQYGIFKNVQTSPLIQAVRTGNRDVIEFLVSTGSNVSQVDQFGNTALHWACTGRHVAMVKYLVSQGSVDVNSRNRDGRTALMGAALKGNRNVFEFLVNMGANESHVDDDGHNILHLASSYGRMEMVRHILSQNLVDINARDKDGNTAAMIAKHESRFHLDSSDGRARVYRRDEERYADVCITQRRPFG
ncbi:26S proteasome non-ATPase regulatory subunit 10-like, partial [Haliotis rubra]|uniref:26S proteasome non-ATPase regulatory subunit 10-like n=1 Tax=Haliotis rubra TaxID=36100 RepID=UPI001EE53C79